MLVSVSAVKVLNEQLTVITDVLLDALGLDTIDGSLVSLPLEWRATIAGALPIHRSLQGVPFPAEQIVTVQAITGSIVHTPDEGLRSIRRPLSLVVKGCFRGLAHVPTITCLCLGEAIPRVSNMISYMICGTLTG